MTKPIELTLEDKKEIAAMEDVREMWGTETEAEFVSMFDAELYAVKYDFRSGSPGYCGDLYVIHGDTLMPPIHIIREDGKLRLANVE